MQRLLPYGRQALRALMVLLLCGGTVCAWASRAGAPEEKAAGAETRRLVYRVSFADPAMVGVELEWRLSRTGTEAVTVPSQWADATGLERAVVDLGVAKGVEARLVPTDRPQRWIVSGKAGSVVRLHYGLRQDWTGPMVEARRHRVMVGPGLVEFAGENGLVAPVLDQGVPVEARFEFGGVAPGRTLVTSFGTGMEQEYRGSWPGLENAFFAEGDLRLRELQVVGGPVLLAVAGKWSFSDQELAGKVQQILQAERSFWGPVETPWYAVVVMPMEGAGGGGTAFTHAFALTMGAKERFGPEAESLVAHEAFHEWNPQALGPVGSGAEVAWFTEGFTTYYQDVLLYRSRLIDRSMYLARLNRVLREERSARMVPAEAAPGERAALDAAVRARAPYLHGAAIALWLNGEIRRQSGGTLDGLMRSLEKEGEAAAEPEPLTNERILRAAGQFVDAGTVQQLRGLLEGDAAVPLPDPASVGACVRFAEHTVWSFDLGFATTELQGGTVLRTVRENSNAYRAGVRNGQRLEGWTLWPSDPDREAVVTVRDASGKANQVHFWPRGQMISVPAAEVPGVFYDAACREKAGQ